MEAPRWAVALFVGVQVSIPTLALLVRWMFLDGLCLPFGWHMYACV
jgi:hypothetical protein